MSSTRRVAAAWMQRSAAKSVTLSSKPDVRTTVHIASIDKLDEDEWRIKGAVEVTVAHVHEFSGAFTAKLKMFGPGNVLKLVEFSGPPSGKLIFQAFLEEARSTSANAMKLSQALVDAK
jgi:hypothetical protein